MNQPLVELHELLLAVGYHVPRLVLQTWPAKLRHRAERWALEQLSGRARVGRPRSLPLWLERHLAPFAVPIKILAYEPPKMSGCSDLNP